MPSASLAAAAAASSRLSTVFHGAFLIFPRAGVRARARVCHIRVFRDALDQRGTRRKGRHVLRTQYGSLAVTRMRIRRCHVPVVVVVAQLLSEAASSYGSRSPMWRRRWLAVDALLTVGDVTFRPRRRDKPHARPRIQCSDERIVSYARFRAYGGGKRRDAGGGDTERRIKKRLPGIIRSVAKRRQNKSSPFIVPIPRGPFVLFFRLLLFFFTDYWK